MIQDIHPHQLEIGFHHKEPAAGDVVIFFRDNRVLLATDSRLPPDWETAQAFCPDVADNREYLFRLDGQGFFLHTGDCDAPPGFDYHDVMSFRTIQPRSLAFAGATACHLAAWRARNRFCGGCGGAMQPKPDERARICPACQTVVYPTIAPAVIVGIVDGDRLLATRYANRPGARLSLVAGFLEIGETLEDAVRREVLEEVGLRVKNVRYYKSQPWAFSGSLLAGFFADLDGPADLTVDTNELQEAMWVPRSEVPADDSGISLTAEMMDCFRRAASPV